MHAQLGNVALSCLHQETRESLGIDLEDSVVIVDEGHNLVDAVNAVHSATMTLGQLATAKSALNTYFTRFSSRLAPGASTSPSHNPEYNPLPCMSALIDRSWNGCGCLHCSILPCVAHCRLYCVRQLIKSFRWLQGTASTSRASLRWRQPCMAVWVKMGEIRQQLPRSSQSTTSCSPRGLTI